MVLAKTGFSNSLFVFSGMANKCPPNRGSVFNKTGIPTATSVTVPKPPPPIRRSSSISSQDAQELASRTSTFRANEDEEVLKLFFLH